MTQRLTLADLRRVFEGVTFRFWTYPRGCRGVVTWEGERATCGECGTSSEEKDSLHEE